MLTAIFLLLIILCPAFAAENLSSQGSSPTVIANSAPSTCEVTIRNTRHHSNLHYHLVYLDHLGNLVKSSGYHLKPSHHHSYDVSNNGFCPSRVIVLVTSNCVTANHRMQVVTPGELTTVRLSVDNNCCHCLPCDDPDEDISYGNPMSYNVHKQLFVYH